MRRSGQERGGWEPAYDRMRWAQPLKRANDEADET
jgi:hypothetical protein